MKKQIRNFSISLILLTSLFTNNAQAKIKDLAYDVKDFACYYPIFTTSAAITSALLLRRLNKERRETVKQLTVAFKTVRRKRTDEQKKLIEENKWLLREMKVLKVFSWITALSGGWDLLNYVVLRNLRQQNINPQQNTFEAIFYKLILTGENFRNNGRKLKEFAQLEQEIVEPQAIITLYNAFREAQEKGELLQFRSKLLIQGIDIDQILREQQRAMEQIERIQPRLQEINEILGIQQFANLFQQLHLNPQQFANALDLFGIPRSTITRFHHFNDPQRLARKIERLITSRLRELGRTMHSDKGGHGFEQATKSATLLRVLFSHRMLLQIFKTKLPECSINPQAYEAPQDADEPVDIGGLADIDE